MLRVIYDEDEQSGRLECPRCGKVYELPGNVLVIREHEKVRHSPNAKNVIYNHFNFDEHSGIPVCSEARLPPGTTAWQAMVSRARLDSSDWQRDSVARRCSGRAGRAARRLLCLTRCGGRAHQPKAALACRSATSRVVTFGRNHR